MVQRAVPFNDLPGSDLVIEKVYLGGSKGNTADDVLSKILPVGNAGGIRVGKKTIVLFSTGAKPEWPDEFDIATGILTYYGDNRDPGKEIDHGKNKKLREMFELAADGTEESRAEIFPFFFFEKAGKDRSVRFRGLFVPGHRSVPAGEALETIWRVRDGRKFKNYRARFSCLSVDVISSKWIEDLKVGKWDTKNCPAVWRKWVKSGRYDNVLTVPANSGDWTKDEQLPELDEKRKWKVLRTVYEYFKDEKKWTGFEVLCAEIIRTTDKRFKKVELTRPAADGGRDIIGTYLIELGGKSKEIEFAVECKCYDPGPDSPNSVGTKETSRLLSRIRHREFGVLMTTSFVAKQAFDEVREDGQPLIFFTGKDLVASLARMGCMDDMVLAELLEKCKSRNSIG